MFKVFSPERDIKTSVSSVNEVLIFDGALFTGSSSDNIARYNHWVSGTASGSLYQSIYNQALGQGSVELMNITYGQSISSSNYNVSNTVNKLEKNKMYRLHAKMLLGDEDERFFISGSLRDELIFLHFKRSQFKDELKKGSTSISLMYSGSMVGANQNSQQSFVFTDTGADGRYTAGERADIGEIKSGSLVGGLIYYQAGIVVLAPELISMTSTVSGSLWSGSHGYNAIASGTNYENVLNSCRFRFRGITTINQSNLQSTYYFVRALNDEFNYSSNPTFLDASQRIIPTSGSNSLQTRTYITKVGLLGESQELLAVASLSTPLKKDAQSEVILKVRLDN